jgi:hypothetical protein
MTNKNYRAGRAFEYEAVQILKDRHYPKAGRTAGSHGPFDVYGIKNGHVVLISCKRPTGVGSITDAHRVWKQDCLEMPKLPIGVDYECWVKIKGQKNPIAWRREH